MTHVSQAAALNSGQLPFAEIWLVDFEFCAPAGERQRPVCMVVLKSQIDELEAEIKKPVVSVKPI